ncbi:EF-hand domain-containing protein [Roseomonas sp. OT10]|uniref:EF-hand domain-containing protein n=1 Tax=Roseomonas cutis TaxID=2897332 RepID=UPI001E5760CE|nr:EF-hand domain-containing protein [Roseomonas sp. OT10]UFN50579.1 EF-hand domain-containing protein [Roseomonas sp. OT10]
MNARTKTPALLALAALLTAGALPALAQPAPRPDAAGRPHGPARLFEAADANHDGRVTLDEAWALASARFAEADANRDGAVTPEELRDFARKQRGNRPIPVRMEQRGEAMFRAIDADRDGRVTLAEFRPVAEAMFRARDRNGDGVLTREELRPQQRGGQPPRGDAPAR